MSVDTKLFVTTENKNFFAWSTVIDTVLTGLVKEGSLDLIPKGFPRFHHYGGSEHVTCSFKYGAENRMLHINFDCDCDHSDQYEGSKVTLSLTCWGSSIYIMETLGEALKSFGTVYFCRNAALDIWEIL